MATFDTPHRFTILRHYTVNGVARTQRLKGCHTIEACERAIDDCKREMNKTFGGLMSPNNPDKPDKYVIFEGTFKKVK